MSSSKKCILFAGVGGVIPTISRLASTYVADPSTPLPESGLYVGLFLFFIIGSILACAFSETDLKQAFILGVCAPGIITNIVAGVNDANLDNQTAQLQSNLFVSSAYAQNNNLLVESAYLITGAEFSTNIVTPIEKNIIIRNQVYDAGEWESKNIPVYIISIKKDGTRETIGSFSANQKTVVVRVPQLTYAVEIRALDQSVIITLPKENFTKVIIDSHIQVGGKNDFLWALGAKRTPKIISVKGKISHIE